MDWHYGVKMSSKKKSDSFSAGLVSKPFWFYEYKLYVEELAKGCSADEIRERALRDNLFSAAKEYRIKEIVSCVSRRAQLFEPSWQMLFTQQDVSNQRIMALISIMADDKLFFTFMYRVYRDKLIMGAENLETADVISFMHIMQNESEEIAQWKDTTIRKLSQAYRRLLNDAGLLDGSRIIPPLLSLEVKNYLKTHDMNAYLMAITGANE